MSWLSPTLKRSPTQGKESDTLERSSCWELNQILEIYNQYELGFTEPQGTLGRPKPFNTMNSSQGSSSLAFNPRQTLPRQLVRIRDVDSVYSTIEPGSLSDVSSIQSHVARSVQSEPLSPTQPANSMDQILPTSTSSTMPRSETFPRSATPSPLMTRPPVTPPRSPARKLQTPSPTASIQAFQQKRQPVSPPQTPLHNDLLSSPLCALCHDPILDSPVLVHGKPYHPHHTHCHICQAPLFATSDRNMQGDLSFVEIEGELYCERHYERIHKGTIF